MEKYGIKYNVTGTEYLSWYDTSTGKYILFHPSSMTVKQALTDFLLADGGYDGSEEDFSVVDVDIPYKYDGSTVTNDSINFVDEAKIVEDMNNTDLA